MRPSRRSPLLTVWRSRACRLVLAVAVVAVGCAAAVAFQGGGDSPAGPFLADPVHFAARLGDPNALVVNVHTPYEGEIDGTDAFIPFDRISGDPRLPADKDTEVLLYCRSGRMSAIAADELITAGYTNVVDLQGGMIAWEAGGRTVAHRTR